MQRKEEERFLDQARAGQDLEELRGEKHADATPGRLRSEEIDLYTLITEEMVEILEGKRPFLEFDSRLDPSLQLALQALFEAHTSRSGETNHFVSGMARSKLLNQALRELQPILAIALRPDFRAGRIMYDRLVGNMNQLRGDINSAILSEMPVKIPRGEEKAEEQDEDEPPSDEAGEADDEGDADEDEAARESAPGDGAADEEKEEADAEGKASESEQSEGSWFGRLLRRRNKGKGEQGDDGSD